MGTLFPVSVHFETQTNILQLFLRIRRVFVVVRRGDQLPPMTDVNKDVLVVKSRTCDIVLRACSYCFIVSDRACDVDVGDEKAF